jgi:hypothetical protein
LHIVGVHMLKNFGGHLFAERHEENCGALGAIAPR